MEFINWVGGRPPQSIAGVQSCGKSLLNGYVDHWDNTSCTANYYLSVCKSPLGLFSEIDEVSLLNIKTMSCVLVSSIFYAGSLRM